MDNKPQTNTVDEDKIFNDISSEMKTRFELLPTELQQAILSSDFQMKLFEIAKKYKLTYEKLGKLEMETTMVLLGMTPPDEYRQDIEQQLEIKGSDLVGVVHDVNEQIFSSIRSSLMNLYKKDEVEEGEKINQGNSTLIPSKNDTYREPIDNAKAPSTIPQTSAPRIDSLQATQKQSPVPPPAPPVAKVEPPVSSFNTKPATPPADKVAELKKQIGMAGGVENKDAPKTEQKTQTLEPMPKEVSAPQKPISPSNNTVNQNMGPRMSVSDIIQKVADKKPILSEGAPKATPVLLNEEPKPAPIVPGIGIETMPKTVSDLEKNNPQQKDTGFFGQIKSIFSEPKKPLDVVIKKEEPETPPPAPPAGNNPTTDPYRESI